MQPRASEPSTPLPCPGQHSLTGRLGFRAVQVHEAREVLLLLLQLVLQPPHRVDAAAALRQQLHLCGPRTQAPSPGAHIPTSAGASGERVFVAPQTAQWLCSARPSSKACFLDRGHLHRHIKQGSKMYFAYVVLHGKSSEHF